MNDYIAVLDKALNAGGEALLRYYGKLERYDTKSSERDLVTIADRESEAAVRAVLKGAYPLHEILGEEQGLEPAPGSDFRWIIDPLDGTTNFAHSVPIFAVSVALEHKGKICVAGVYNPVSEERFLAEAGAGATLNEKRIRVSSVGNLPRSLLVTGFPHSDRHVLQLCLREVGYFLGKVHGILRLGAAALDMCFVACGRMEVFWQRNLNPWDTAAGWLIVEEANGKVTNFSGGKFSPYEKELVCSNGLVHEEFLTWLSNAHKLTD
ncbi:MAG: inositol monophosphatase family protein [Candidatus Sumerlaeaceae bacterium]|jgi:myo-inositol-1(or 4)-monophosphatase